MTEPRPPYHIPASRDTADQPQLETWAVVEIFGHERIAGLVTEETIAGQGFIRVDVPATDDTEPFTKLYGPNAIYAMTPVSKDVALTVINLIQAQPLGYWTPDVRKKLPGQIIDPD